MNFQAFINVTKPSALFLFEPYAPGWVATLNGEEVLGEPLFDRFVSFNLYETGTFNFRVIYGPQEYFNTAIILSLTCLLVLIILVIILNKKKDFLSSASRRFGARGLGLRLNYCIYLVLRNLFSNSERGIKAEKARCS